MKKILLKFADNLLSREQMKEVKGGIGLQEYCSNLCTVMRYCYSTNNSTCVQNAGTAWSSNGCSSC
jgi:hypothetical protein